MTRPHAYSLLSGFCERCGAARADVEDGRRPVTCDAGPNVVAVSHLVATKPLRDLARKVLTGR